MAVQKRHDPDLEALILQAAAEVKRANPHIGEPPQPYTDDEYALLQQETATLDRLWDEIEQQRGGAPTGEPAADAVDADRGE